MNSRNTRPITWATIAEIVSIASILTLLVVRLEVVGAVAAAAAFLGGEIDRQPGVDAVVQAARHLEIP